MTGPEPAIRRATAADAAALAEFAARVFRAVYAGCNDPADIDLHVGRNFATSLQEAEIAAPGCCYLLALESAAIVGYACLQQGAAHPAAPGPMPCELRRFYVDPARHGRGVAALLMAAAVREAHGAGARTLWLLAWEHYPRARRFYAKQGFADVGQTTFVLGRSAQTDRLLVRALD